MDDTGLSSALSNFDVVKDVMTVKRVFGDAYQVDGVSIIPVAAVRGGGGVGGGGGIGPEDQGKGSGAGMGFGANARPVGVFVVKDGSVSWRPSVDVLQIVLGGQLLALAAIVTIRRALLHRHRHRR
jgi:uncharacterized spore protein YtfJ